MPAIARQLDLVDDTPLRDDVRLAARTPQFVKRGRIAPAPLSSSSVSERVAAIKRKQKAGRISNEALCRSACVSFWTWRAIRRGNQTPTDATLRKLEQALAEPGERKPPAMIRSYHALVMRLVAEEHAFPIDELMATDFSKQRPSNPRWLIAARIRQIAHYILTVEIEVQNVDLGRALGETRANVAFARNQVEQRRDDPEIDRIIDAVTRKVKGEA